MGIWVNLLKKENLQWKSIFLIMMNGALKSCKKNWCKTTRNKRAGSCILQIFTEVPSQNLKCSVK